MTHKGLVRYYQHQVEDELIEVLIVEDADIPEGETYIQGFFNNYFDGDGDKTPIQIEIITKYNADVDDSELDAIDSEFIKTVNHEMTHYTQWIEGRFITDWTGDYADNPNEIEAYANEGTGSLFFTDK
mgnify:CR=1 FL=1